MVNGFHYMKNNPEYINYESIIQYNFLSSYIKEKAISTHKTEKLVVA